MKRQGFWTHVTCLGLWSAYCGTFLIQAASVEFTLDATRSTVTISGTVVGNTVKEQGPGGLTTSYTGTIKTEVTDATIQFTGGSLIQANNNGSWQPQAEGLAGSAPANYGGAAESFIGSAKAALRNIQLDVTSPALTLTNDSFEADGLLFQFLPDSAASLDYLITSFLGINNGSEPLAGYSTNRVTTRSSLVTSNGVQTLTIPLNATIVFGLLSDNDSPFTLQGQLVATRTLGPVGTTLQSIQVTNQQVTLQWASVPGQQYQVESTIDWQTWTPRADPVTATTESTTWSANADQAVEFFRIKQL